MFSAAMVFRMLRKYLLTSNVYVQYTKYNIYYELCNNVRVYTGLALLEVFAPKGRQKRSRASFYVLPICNIVSCFVNAFGVEVVLRNLKVHIFQFVERRFLRGIDVLLPTPIWIPRILRRGVGKCELMSDGSYE